MSYFTWSRAEVNNLTITYFDCVLKKEVKAFGLGHKFDMVIVDYEDKVITFVGQDKSYTFPLIIEILK